MNINRHNYEEFFILYMDKELSSEDRRRVELFVAENPDLKAELDLLLQSQLIPDTTVVFNNKEQLQRSSSGAIAIDASNYEEWLFSYVDNELPADQRMAVEKFVSGHPAIKAELDILQQTKLQPDTAVVFANKEILYRSEEKVRVIGMNWKRIAVAAALLLAVSSTALLLLNKKDVDQPGVAVNPGVKKSEQSNPVPAPKQQPANEMAAPDMAVANEAGSEIKENRLQSHDAGKQTKKMIEPKQKNAVPGLSPDIKENEAVLADITEKKPGTNNLSQPTSNPNVINGISNNPIAMSEPVAVKESPLTNIKETNSTAVVTPVQSQPLDNMIAVANQEPTKKNKLRGFFRKVTRTFEKNTNIKATDDEDRLLLGGLAIQL